MMPPMKLATMKVTPGRAFLLCLLVGSVGVPAIAWLDKPVPRRETFNAVVGGVPAQGITLTAGVTVKDQIKPEAMPWLRQAGVRTIIALRPDGEEHGQASSRQIEVAASAAGITFAYIPTPVHEIPDAIVDQLSRVLAASERPVLLYCGSGWRAARVWALTEASRDGGADAATIMTVVQGARHDIEDLKPRIDARITKRKGVL